MNNTELNPISEYYIAYFDMLGYKAFFQEHHDKVASLLSSIHDAITKTKNYLQSINNSPLAQMVGNLNIQSKIFSDNILLCIEVGTDDKKEKARIVAFMMVVSEIQRGFILEDGLFLRGGFTKGNLSINDDYVFGDGLIDAVTMEEHAIHPRIVVSEAIVKYLWGIYQFTAQELDQAIEIEKKLNDGEHISLEDQRFYTHVLQVVSLERRIFMKILYWCSDDVWCLSYLYRLDVSEFISKEVQLKLQEMIKQVSPADYERMTNTPAPIEAILKAHAEIVKEKLRRYSDYSSIPTNEIKRFEIQENVLKKYVWAMVYHNDICTSNNRLQYFINTIANCERRHMKLMINVLESEKNE